MHGTPGHVNDGCSRRVCDPQTERGHHVQGPEKRGGNRTVDGGSHLPAGLAGHSDRRTSVPSLPPNKTGRGEQVSAECTQAREQLAHLPSSSVLSGSSSRVQSMREMTPF